MVLYVPGTEETDLKKIIMSVQQIAPVADAASTGVTANSSAITTLNSSVTALQTKTNGYEAAWTSWSPTVTAGAGSFGSITATGGYQVIGKTVTFAARISIVNAGTASGAMASTLPIGTSARDASVLATETQVVGLMGYGRIYGGGGTTIASILKYDNSSYIGTGYVVVLSGCYERT